MIRQAIAKTTTVIFYTIIYALAFVGLMTIVKGCEEAKKPVDDSYQVVNNY